MRNLLLIGGSGLERHVEALRGEGFGVVLRLPAGDEGDEGQAFDVVIVEIAAAAEDATAKRLLDSARTGEGPPVIALIESGQLERDRGKGGSVRLAAAEAPRRERRTRRGEEKT